MLFGSIGLVAQLADHLQRKQPNLVNSPSQLTPLLVLGFIGGLYSFWKGLGLYRVYRVEGDIPRIPVRSVAMGLTHVGGTAEGAETMVSPVSQTPCLFYRVLLERPSTSAAARRSRWTVVRVSDIGPVFGLDDGTGRVAIDLHGASFFVAQSAQCEMDPVSAYAAAGGTPELVAPSSIGGTSAMGQRYRVTEFVILPGMEYDITGLCVENPDSQDGRPRNLIRSGGETFLISDQSARNTQMSLRRQAAAKVFGGAFVAITCLAGLLTQFGLM